MFMGTMKNCASVHESIVDVASFNGEEDGYFRFRKQGETGKTCNRTEMLLGK